MNLLLHIHTFKYGHHLTNQNRAVPTNLWNYGTRWSLYLEDEPVMVNKMSVIQPTATQCHHSEKGSTLTCMIQKSHIHDTAQIHHLSVP